MPVIKLQHVVSVSSEDKNHPAENIVKGDTYKKWKCASGEKQASLVLQLEKASCIHSIDVGNEGSAFIEVLVGCQTDSDQKNYQVLLVASSFMSPLESRNGTNTNRVRIFASDKLSKSTLDKKWDRVKIVCTQPFNKTSQYGLSFIKFHSPPDSSQGSTSETTSNVQATRVFSFNIKENENDEAESLLPGSFFAKRKTIVSPPKGAAEIRAASAKAEAELMFASSKTNKQTPAKRKLDMKGDDDEEVESKVKKTKTPTLKPVTPSSSVRSSSSESKKKTISVKKVETKTVPLDEIMSGVVFVLSGFQNPLRADLRDKAQEMGAKYRPDWNEGCTHLICAFSNTPKFQQVKKARGHIVTKQWILDCYRKKVAFSWKQYELKGKNDDDDGSENSDTDVEEANQSKPQSSNTTADGNLDEGEKSALKREGDSEDEYGGSTDVDGPESSGGDSDTPHENIRRVMKVNTVGEGDYANDDVDKTSEVPLPSLPDFFGGSVFFLYGEFEGDERRRLVRYITAFNGRLEEYMNKLVKYVITKSDWDDNFDEALVNNGSLIFAKPRWLLACATQRRLVPHQPYIVVPREM